MGEERGYLRAVGSLALLLVGLTAIGFVFFGIWGEYNRARSIDTLIAEMEAERDRIAAENRSIREEISRYDTDDKKKRKAQETGFREAGAQTIIITGLEEQEHTDQQVQETSATNKTHVEIWRDIFFAAPDA